MAMPPLSKYRVSVLPSHFDRALPLAISTELCPLSFRPSGSEWRNLRERAIVGEIPGQAGNDGGNASAKAGMTGERMTRVLSGVRSGVAVGPFGGPTGRFGRVFRVCRYSGGTYGRG